VAIPLHDLRGDLMHPDYVASVKKEAAEIERDFPGSLLMFYEKMPFAPRCALFATCDVLVMPSVRHGLSLVPFELVMCSAYGQKQASLCVSEFAACSRVLPCCVRINPFRDEDTAKAIAKCLQQSPFERKHHHSQQVEWCLTHTVLGWAEMILLDMKRWRAEMRESGKEFRSALNRVGLVKSNYAEISGSVLKPELVNGAYLEATTRLVIVDVDLLIRPREEMGDDKKSSFLRSLQMLVNESGNLVFLLSSETPEHLLSWLGGREERWLEKIGLAAEDGYYYKWPGSPVERWDVRLEVPVQWKEMCKNILQSYTQRTTGSFMEDNKVASLIWYYGNTDPQFGAMQGKELLNHLEETSAHMPVEIVMGKSFVRVRHKEITKGALIRHVVNHYNNRGGVDFILCLGDDKMEKDMFTTLVWISLPSVLVIDLGFCLLWMCVAWLCVNRARSCMLEQYIAWTVCHTIRRSRVITFTANTYRTNTSGRLSTEYTRARRNRSRCSRAPLVLSPHLLHTACTRLRTW
jgi:trehalose 6-phosphate synthase/phosphatase